MSRLYKVSMNYVDEYNDIDHATYRPKILDVIYNNADGSSYICNADYPDGEEFSRSDFKDDKFWTMICRPTIPKSRDKAVFDFTTNGTNTEVKLLFKNVGDTSSFVTVNDALTIVHPNLSINHFKSVIYRYHDRTSKKVTGDFSGTITDVTHGLSITLPVNPEPLKNIKSIIVTTTRGVFEI